MLKMQKVFSFYGLIYVSLRWKFVPKCLLIRYFLGGKLRFLRKTCYVHFIFFLNYKCVISATASNTSKPSKNSQEMQDIHTEKTQETRRNYSRKNIKIIVEKLPK